MVDLIRLPVLRNNYYVMRHGQSLANTAGIIVSDPQNGIDNYGLSELGREQVKSSIDRSLLQPDTCIVSSDFKRARETAEIVQQNMIHECPIWFEQKLRERNFGKLELGPDTRYVEVWENDRQDTETNSFDAESVHSVARRAAEVVIEFEKRLQEKSCLLIAHGDILQILQTVFSGISATLHRELPHLETAEIRLLKIQSDR